TIQPVERTIWIRFTLSHQKVLTYQVVDSDPEFHASGTLNLDIPLPLDVTAFATATLVKDDVVAIRIGTDAEDILNEQAFLDWWGGNRLGTAQWGVFLAGTVFGHEIAKQLNTVAKQVTDASSDPKIEVTYPVIESTGPIPHHNGAWLLPQRYAEAQV